VPRLGVRRPGCAELHGIARADSHRGKPAEKGHMSQLPEGGGALKALHRAVHLMTLEFWSIALR
jgi:hypothetical protein